MKLEAKDIANDIVVVIDKAYHFAW